MTDRSRPIALFLALLLCLSLLPATALATDLDAAEGMAQALYTDGLFQGKGTHADGSPDFALEDSATRNEAATMLIRLMGQEDKARRQLAAGTLSDLFTDVPAWAKSTVAWLYENDYVNGTSAKRYSGGQIITAQQFAALLLRALGYSEREGDFSYAGALSFAASIGLVDPQQETAAFRRAEMVEMCYRALSLTKKDSELTLRETLDRKGVFSHRDTSAPSQTKAVRLTLKYANGGKDSKGYVQEATSASPVVADLNGDGKQEIVFSARAVSCLDGATGSVLWSVNSGLDRRTARTSSGDFGRASAQVKVLDVDGDGRKEILTVHTNYETKQSVLALYTDQGYFEPGWPVVTQKPVYALTASDMDGDGRCEICVGLGVGATKEPALYVFGPDGQVRAGWPQSCDYGLFADSMATVDLDQDGRQELVLLFDDQFMRAYTLDGDAVLIAEGAYQGLFWSGLPFCEDAAFEAECVRYARNHMGGSCFASGLAVYEFPHRTREWRYVLYGTYGGIVAADLDGDGTTELACTGLVADATKIMTSSENTYANGAKYFPPFLLSLDRTRYVNTAKGYDWTQPPVDTGRIVTLDASLLPKTDHTPVAADVDGDGEKEILYTANDAKVHCWDLDGTEHGAWPYSLVKRSSSVLSFATKPAVADVNGDGKQEVIFASYTQLGQKTQRGSLYVLDGTGKPLATVVLPPALSSSAASANGCMAQPTMADVDRDGKPEIVLTTIFSGIVVYDIG